MRARSCHITIPFARMFATGTHRQKGAGIHSFLERISEPNQDRLEAEGGACIMYAHFGHGFCEDGGVNRRFKELIRRLSGKNGWFAAVSKLLEFLRNGRNPVITDAQRI